MEHFKLGFPACQRIRLFPDSMYMDAYTSWSKRNFILLIDAMIRFRLHTEAELTANHGNEDYWFRGQIELVSEHIYDEAYGFYQ